MNPSTLKLVKGAAVGGFVLAGITAILFAFDQFFLYPALGAVAAGTSFAAIAIIREYR